MAPDFRMMDNDKGPIGGVTDEVEQPPVSGEEQTPVMQAEEEQQLVEEEVTGNLRGRGRRRSTERSYKL